MKLEIRTYPDPVLAEPCGLVGEITPELETLIENMVETMYEDDGVGLAAPQVGESIRLICLDQTGPKERKDLMVLLDPVIVEREGELESEEACLSVPGFNTKVIRAEKVAVEARDRQGEAVHIDAEGYLAVILQHEIDHLDGRIILDYAGRLKRSMYEKKLKKWAKQKR